MTATPDKYRKPQTSPSPSDVDNGKRWDKLADASLTTTQAAAEKWRTGLAAFVTLVTGGLLIKGPEAAQDLDRGWLLLITVLAVGGLGTAIVGLWLALRAAAGSPARANLLEVISVYGGVRQYEVAAAGAASKNLKTARTTVAVSLVLLGLTVIAWWWTPVEAKSPPALVKVEHGDDTTCGKLASGDDSELRVEVDGESDETVLSFDDIDNVRIVATC